LIGGELLAEGGDFGLGGGAGFALALDDFDGGGGLFVRAPGTRPR